MSKSFSPKNSSLKKPLISFEKVSFNYNKNKTDDSGKQNWILKDFSTSIYHNSLTLLKGKNGSGKSTLLKLLLNSKNDNLSSGKISKYYTNAELGYLSQDVHREARYPLTVLEFLCIQQANLKKNDKKLRSLLEQLGLWEIRHQNFPELSGGEKQKTYLLRTVLISPKIILMDEPLSYLDKESEREFAKLIGNLLTEKATIIMAIHDDDWLSHLPSTIKRKYQINTLQLK